MPYLTLHSRGSAVVHAGPWVRGDHTEGDHPPLASWPRSQACASTTAEKNLQNCQIWSITFLPELYTTFITPLGPAVYQVNATTIGITILQGVSQIGDH